MDVINAELTIVFDKEDMRVVNHIISMTRCHIASCCDLKKDVTEHGLPPYDKYQMKRILDMLETFEYLFPKV